MEVSYSALDAEAGLSYDTTVRVSVHASGDSNSITPFFITGLQKRTVIFPCVS